MKPWSRYEDSTNQAVLTRADHGTVRQQCCKAPTPQLLWGAGSENEAETGSAPPTRTVQEPKGQDLSYSQSISQPCSPLPPLSSSAWEPATVIITVIIIILIRTSDLSKYYAEGSHVSSCRSAKKEQPVRCWCTAPCTPGADSTSKFLFMQLSD